VGALKPVLDALPKVGYFHDDSETWLELLPVRQQHSAAGASSDRNRDRSTTSQRRI